MQELNRLPLIGDVAPAFEAATTQGTVSFPGDYKGRWVVFFSHPADFTPVCTTEFMAFAAAQDRFAKLGCDLIGLSVDSTYSHIAWLRTIKEKIQYDGMRNVDIRFPVVSDLSMAVSRKYGMIQPWASTTQAVRAVFVIDPKGIVRALLYYPLSNGRNVEEILRLVTALQETDRYKVATPANWQPGQDVIIPAPGSCGMAQKRVERAGKGYRCLDWFLCLKKAPKETVEAGR